MQNIGRPARPGHGLKPLVFPCALVLAFSSAAVAGDEEPLPPSGAIEIDAPEPHEISGVAAVPGEYGGYAVVGDEESKVGRIWPGGAVWRAAIKGRGKPAKGLESVDIGIGPNGRRLWLVLGENNRTVSDLFGVNYRLPKEMGYTEEVCGRGLEGLAVRWKGGKWQVAVLWEGGYYDEDKCEKVPKPDFALPGVTVFEWVPRKGGDGVEKLKFKLQVPPPSDKERFRAPDLAWLDDDSDRLIVLLSSTGVGGGKPFEHTWLQVFDLKGIAVDEPFKLEDEWGKYRKGKNWEALDHSLDRSRLVMGFDAKRGRRSLVVFPSPFRK